MVRFCGLYKYNDFVNFAFWIWRDCWEWRILFVGRNIVCSQELLFVGFFDAGNYAFG